MNAAPPFDPRILACLKAPGHDDACRLEVDGEALRCADSGERFEFVRGVPSLYAPAPGEAREVTDKVRSFYEEHPFPSYEGLEEFGELVSKGLQNPFTARLLRAIGYNRRILECGCGTGQLSNFLQLNNNHVLGIDLSLGSLSLALEHKQRNQLARSSFAQMNIFNLALKDACFDVVISHGVLHHTYDARSAFAQIVRKARPGGIVMVGLYNRIARIPTWLRSKLVGRFGPRIDYVVRTRIHDARKAEIWIRDQYYNPHETWHSIDEVMGWFEENRVEFLHCSPRILGAVPEEPDDLFASTPTGNRLQRIATQVGWLGSIAREGALFDLVGRRVRAD